MKHRIALLIGVVAALGAIAGVAHAQDAASDNAVKVAVTGTNYCVPCALKEQGAQASCSVNGHQLALKVTDIYDEDGNYIRGFVNKTFYYIDNAKGKELADNADLLGKAVTIEGTLFKDERIVDIASFKEAAGGGVKPDGITNRVGSVPGAAPPAAPAEGQK